MTTTISTSILHWERDTKRTHLFKTDSEDAAVSTLYIQKSELTGRRPERITVTIEAC